MTSLQQQLAVIAANSTKQLDIKAQRSAHAKSLLFAPKVAVSQNYDVLYQICREGFEELCSLDPRFNVFSNTLFSEQSKSEEREQMTAAQNKELDVAIGSFLDLVASKILLKPGMKSLEWLIRRFKAHEYNTEHLNLVFLPYHADPVYLNLLAILPPRLPANMKFLRPYVAALTNPPIHAIIYAATNNPSFFKAVNRQVLDSSKAGCASNDLVRFWTVFVSQAIDGLLTAAQSGISSIKKDRVESVLLLVLPILDDVLQLSDSTDMEIAACMIITILAARAGLSDNVKARFMEAISSTWNAATIDARLICLVALTQEDVPKKLPKKVAKKLLSTKDLTPRLATISQSYRSSNLISVICQYCIARFQKTDCQQEVVVLTGLFDADLLRGNALTNVLRMLASKIMALSKEEVHALQQNVQNFAKLQSSVRNTIPRVATSLLETCPEIAMDSLQSVFQIQSQITAGSDDEMDLDESAPTALIVSNDVTQSIALDSVKIPSLSFLTSSEYTTANQAASVVSMLYEQTLSTAVLAHPSLKRDDTKNGSVLYTTLLIRLACTQHRSTNSRVQMLLQLRHAVQELLDAGYNVQNAVPYLLALSQDRSSKIRRIAISVLQDFSNQIHTESRVWAAQSMYGHSTPQIILNSDGIGLLIKDMILPRSSEILTDPSSLSGILKASMMAKQSSKKKTKGLICNFLAWHASMTPILAVQSSLLGLLSGMGKIAAEARSTIGIEGLERWSSLPMEEVISLCANENYDLLSVNTGLLTTVLPDRTANLERLSALLSKPMERLDVVRASHMRLRHIWQDIGKADRLALSLKLVDLSLRDTKSNRQLRDLANETLRSLPFQSEDLVQLLQLPALPSTRIAKRESRSAPSLDSAEVSAGAIDLLRRYTRILEITETAAAECDEGETELLTRLFGILGDLQGFGMHTDSSLIYLKSLTINILLSAVNRMVAAQKRMDSTITFRIDLVVDTMANSSNVQLQQSCLLLIAGLARLIPETVLHSVMPIFTLMSSTILRQADDFSAHVIRQTISHVIPPIVESLRQHSKDFLGSLANIFNSFTTAFEYIPSHRRLDLYKQLVDALGVDDSLFAMACLLRIRHPTDVDAKDVVTQLTRSFPPELMLKMLLQTVDLTADVFVNQPTLSDVLLQVKDMSESDSLRIADILLDTLTSLLNDGVVRSRIASSMKFDAENAATQQAAFSKLMGSSIQLVQRLQRTECSQSAEYMLGGVFGLLPLEDLVICAQMLFDSASTDVRNVVIMAVSNKVRSLKQINKVGSDALLALLSTLDGILETAEGQDDRLHVINCSLSIAEKVGRLDSAAVGRLVARLMSEQCLSSPSQKLQIQSLITITRLVSLLGDALLPQVPSLLKQCFSLFQLSIESDEDSAELVATLFRLMGTICQKIPVAIAGEYLDSALQLAQLSIDSSVVSIPTRDSFYQAIVQNVPAPVIISALDRNFESISTSQGFNATIEYYKLAKSVVTQHTKSSILKNSKSILKFIKQALDLRATASSNSGQRKFSDAELEDLELLAIDIALTLVLKLNDAVVRPFFIQLVDDATFKADQPALIQIARATTLFKLTQSLLHRLGNLVISYVSYVLDLSSHVMHISQQGVVDMSDLLSATLGALRQSFIADSDEFWQSPTRFSAIVSPMITLLGTPLSTHIGQQLVSTITAFAAAASSADHFKALNSQILPLFRAPEPKARLIAVQCQRSLTDALGEDWLVLLPEMLPMITELLEDDDEMVERETRLWIKNIEEMVGESLDSMLQ